MTKVIGMLVALAVFAAMPAVAFAGGDGNDNIASGNEQSAEINQGAAGGDGGDGGGDGGDAGNQAAVVQQNAGDDANASIDQEQNFGGGDGDNDGNGDNDNDNDGFGGGDDDDNDGFGGGDDDDNDNVTSGGIGGGSESVTLARTGFDAWMLALLGGLSLAGGIGLLAAQRRGRLNA